MDTDPDDAAFATPATKSDDGAPGLTKREYFAALVMQGIVARPDSTNSTAPDLAQGAVRIADALITALNE